MAFAPEGLEAMMASAVGLPPAPAAPVQQGNTVPKAASDYNVDKLLKAQEGVRHPKTWQAYNYLQGFLYNVEGMRDAFVKTVGETEGQRILQEVQAGPKPSRARILSDFISNMAETSDPLDQTPNGRIPTPLKSAQNVGP